MRSERLTGLNCLQVRTPFLSLMRAFPSNMLSNLSSLLRDMFPTYPISPTSPRKVEKKNPFAPFFLFLQFFCCFNATRCEFLLRLIIDVKLVCTLKCLISFFPNVGYPIVHLDPKTLRFHSSCSFYGRAQNFWLKKSQRSS